MQCKKVGNRICTFIWYFIVCTAYCRPPSKRHLSYNVIRIPSNSRISRGETSRTCQIQCLMIELDVNTVFENHCKMSHFTTMRAKRATFVYKLTYLNFRAKNPKIRIIKLGTKFKWYIFWWFSYTVSLPRWRGMGKAFHEFFSLNNHVINFPLYIFI